MKILIVDDKPENLYMLEALLKGTGYDIISARNGAEALGLARKEIPRMIISDILMPIMDGYSLCREFKRDVDLQNVPFIFYTATYTDKKDEEFALSLGADRFILKPADPDKFLEIVQDVLLAVATKKIKPKKPPDQPELVVLKEYNATLIRKLEDKMLQTEENEKQLKKYIKELEEQILARIKAEAEIQKLNQELEERVKQRTTELEEANKELEAFSYTVSHDLRAPLRALSSFSALLLKEHSEHLDGEIKDFINSIISNAKSMSQMVEDLLTFSKYNKREIIKFKFEMNQVVESVIAGLPANYEKDKYKIVIHDLGNACGDLNLIKQVWINLISNAIKFSVFNDHPTIEIGMQENGNQKVYFVKDNGVGFDTRYADKLFGVFQRLHTATEFEGTGVGLAIVHRIVTRHGGTVRAVSELGKGSTFYFSLPEIECE